MERDLVDDLHENWAGWLSTKANHVAGGESRIFGSIQAISVGAPIPLFNQAFVFDEPDEADLVEATAWLSARNVPFWVTAPKSVAGAVTERAEPAGLVFTGAAMPGMALASFDDLVARPPADVEIRLVGEPAGLEDVAVVTGDAFEAPPDTARMLAPDSILDEDGTATFVGFVDGEPAACGELFRTGDVAGVYTIGVREKFRRRGLGYAISTAVLEAGREQGCNVGVLQASPMGYPVYEQMGLTTVMPYHLFVPAPG